MKKNRIGALMIYCVAIASNSVAGHSLHEGIKHADTNFVFKGNANKQRSYLLAAADSKVCCLSRESVDGGRRIAPVYRVRKNYCERNEETVEIKFCGGVPW